MAGIGLDAGSSGGIGLSEPETVEKLSRWAHGDARFSGLDLGTFGTPESLCHMLNTGSWGQPKLASTGTVPDTTVGRRGPFTELGVVQTPRRRLRLLDLIPSSPAVGNTIPYIVMAGNHDAGAAETAEGAMKPTMDIELTDQESPIRTIAEWVKAARQILDDVPGLTEAINSTLTYDVLRRLEKQIVSGDGSGQNLTGILNTTGIASVPYAAGTALTDLALAGLVAILSSEGDPDAQVMNPATLSKLLTPKASGSGEYLSIDSPFGAGPSALTLWGVPVITSTVMPVDQILYGSFSQGCRVWIRQAVNVAAGNDSDDWTRNRITLLGEMRAGLTVHIPSYFALVRLDAQRRGQVLRQAAGRARAQAQPAVHPAAHGRRFRRCAGRPG